MKKAPPTTPHLAMLVESATGGRRLRFMPAHKVIALTAEVYSEPPARLTGEERHKGVAEARHLAMFLIRATLGLGYPEIGRLFHRDHSTVMTGIAAVAERLSQGEYALVERVRAVVASDEREAA